MEATKSPKRIPYGISSYLDIIDQDCYYVDKTAYIEQIERADNFFFFIRPRRFGKSLLLSTLEHYYDINSLEQFETLFGDTYIGQHPTPKRNSYLVLKLNFSTLGGGMGNYRDPLNVHCQIQFKSFCERYCNLLPAGTLEEFDKYTEAIGQLQFICNQCYKVGQKLYLLIDEYDHFTNDILSNPDRLADYEAETHAEGYLRQFFNTIKAGTDTAIKKLFVTGVSPVTLDDLTSGFNIGTNYTNNPKFNGMVGFSEQEVRQMLEYYAGATGVFKHATDELIQIMAPYYNHYCFAEERYGQETMYNSNMVLYFVNHYIDRNGKLPKDMLDANIRTDYDKLRLLVHKDKEFSPDASTIQQIANAGYIVSEVNPHFPAKDIAKPSNLISLLYYFGMLTYGGYNDDGDTRLIIPNQVVREQFYTVLLRLYEDIDLTQDDKDRRILESKMASKGEWQNYIDYIAERLRIFASTRDVQKGEYLVHGFVLAMVSLSNRYFPYSEADTNGGYADILLSPRSNQLEYVNHSYVIEFKYVKTSAPQSAVDAAITEATAQVERYAEARHAVELSRGRQLHKLCVVFRGLTEVVYREV